MRVPALFDVVASHLGVCVLLVHNNNTSCICSLMLIVGINLFFFFFLQSCPFNEDTAIIIIISPCFISQRENVTAFDTILL